MALEQTPVSERPHIAFFGLRNAGKSSLINAVTAQTVSVVSDTPGTTTDPVTKSMELLPLGPIVIIDTPGIDDEGALGKARVARTKEVLRRTDIAVLVTEATRIPNESWGTGTMTHFSSSAGQPEVSSKKRVIVPVPADSFEVQLLPAEEELITIFEERKIPYVIVLNKCDLLEAGDKGDGSERHQLPMVTFRTVPFVTCLLTSALTGAGIHELKEHLATLKKEAVRERPIVSDLVNPLDVVVLVTPIDESAPKGRLILPQQLTLRELLDHGAIPVVVKDTEYAEALKALQGKPALVITDSQVFEVIDALTPADVPLTSFSILMARYKGTLNASVAGAHTLDELHDGDTILISEGCTHHRQCKDIGTVKMPGWIDAYTGKNLQYAFTSGGTFQEDLSPYALIVHCGGCMLNEQEMTSRAMLAEQEDTPMTNYGIAIAKMHGILERSVAMLQGS